MNSDGTNTDEQNLMPSDIPFEHSSLYKTAAAAPIVTATSFSKIVVFFWLLMFFNCFTDNIYAWAIIKYMGDQMSAKRKKKQKPAALPVFNDKFCIELSGNREAVLEGSKGVLEYSSERIRVNTSDMIIVFTGRELDLRCISDSALIIDGFITDIGFSV